MDEGIRFDHQGLVPCISQDEATGQVLTVAYMNAEALELTKASGELHLYSRSRREIWHKGGTSGNIQRVVQLRYDCDGDTVLAIVRPEGPACHTGQRSCFYRELGGSAATEPDAPPAPGEPAPAAFEALAALEETLQARASERPAASYTVELLERPERIAEKILEEAQEVADAAAGESAERVSEEAADLLYHLCVLLISRGVPQRDVMEVLNGRRR